MSEESKLVFLKSAGGSRRLSWEQLVVYRCSVQSNAVVFARIKKGSLN